MVPCTCAVELIMLYLSLAFRVVMTQAGLANEAALLPVAIGCTLARIFPAKLSDRYPALSRTPGSTQC
jgi:hypothetical protein